MAHLILSVSGNLSVSERWLRRILWTVSIFSAVAVLATAITLFWAKHEFSQPESIVGAQSLMLLHRGTLYYDLNRYPYTVCAYTPVFYCLQAVLAGAGIPVPLAGRLLSFAALLGIFWICWRIVLLYTADRYAAWTAALLASSTSLLLHWGSVGQVDTLANFLALTAFYYYSRWQEKGERTLLLSGGFALLAFFTKQTMLAAPSAIVLMMFMKNRKIALRFAVLLVSSIAALALPWNRATGGRFFENTVFANINPFDVEKLLQHLRYMSTASVGLLLVAACTIMACARKRGRAVAVYLAFALLLLAAMASKVGSDSNYQIEFTILLILCSTIGLHETGFFPLCLAHSKSWVTLLAMPLLLHCYLNYRVVVGVTIARVAKERLFRQEVAELRPYVDYATGRIISTEIDAMLYLRGRLDLEPLIYTLLAKAGKVDPEPVRRDLAARSIPLVILYEDIFHGPADPNLEFPRLPPSQMDTLRQNYRLADHIAGPNLGGAYVYLPLKH